MLVVLTRSATFFHDEWFYIGDGPGYDVGRSLTDPASWFRPHNEHLVALHVVVYMALQAMFGLTTYLPYLLVLFAAHVGVALGVYALIDRHVGRNPALIAAALLLFLGSGYLDLFWAFQMGFVGAVALGLWAVIVARDRPGLSGVLMALGILTQGTALFLVPAVALYGRSKRAWAAAAVPALIYATWYIAIGRATMNVRGDAPTVAGGVSYLVDGIARSTAALTGFPAPVAVLLLVLADVALLLAWRRRRDLSAAIVGMTSLLTMYGILAISRQGFDDPGDPHYVYLGAAFLLPLFATAWTVIPRAARPAVAVLAVVAIAVNALELVHHAAEWPTYIVLFGP